MESKEHRQERRERSRRTALRRHSDHLWSWGCGEPGATLCRFCAEPTINIWVKCPVGRCPCRKRKHGRPRADVGMCDTGSRSRVYHWRNQVRELNRMFQLRHVEPDCDAVTLLASPVVHPWD